MLMLKRATRELSITAVLVTAAVLLAWPATGVAAQAKTQAKSSAKAATMTGHPQKQHGSVAVPQCSTPMPSPKSTKAPKAQRENVIWVPGDYYWGGDNWLWDEGFWLDKPWSEAVWIPGHWTQRWWGWSWVPGYWF
jgi:hypothetical protein